VAVSDDQSPAVLDDGGVDFSRLPTVPQAEDLIDQAFRRGRKAQAAKGAPGELGKNRELARVGAASRQIESSLHRVIRSFPSLDELHPFYRELVDVTQGLDELKQRLGHVEWTRKQVQQIRAEAEDDIRNAAHDDERTQVRKAAYGRMASLVEEVTEDLADLEQARHDLAGLPTLTFDDPVLVVAGHPNVGKSSLLDLITRASPKVAEYPFTTKGVHLGHRDHERYKVQVMDTPGLLDRPMAERNDIERQAVLALEHAADAILYVLDPSGHCGYPLEEQEHLLAELDERFDVPFVVVENKADLETTGERPATSCETGEGVEDAVTEALDRALEAYRDRVDLGFE
jgi:nucleolar GTP-binding protein